MKNNNLVITSHQWIFLPPSPWKASRLKICRQWGRTWPVSVTRVLSPWTGVPVPVQRLISRGTHRFCVTVSLSTYFRKRTWSKILLKHCRCRFCFCFLECMLGGGVEISLIFFPHGIQHWNATFSWKPCPSLKHSSLTKFKLMLKH